MELQANTVYALNQTSMDTRRASMPILNGLIGSDDSGVLFAAVASTDGRCLAHTNSTSADVNPQRMAAIVTSLLGLVESMSREGLGSRSLYNYTVTDRGAIAVVRIPTQYMSLVLCVCTDAAETLAMTIRYALDAAEKIAKELDSLS